jgi:hypothetical protein
MIFDVYYLQRSFIRDGVRGEFPKLRITSIVARSDSGMRTKNADKKVAEAIGGFLKSILGSA